MSTPAPDVPVLKTYRYLRLAMVVLVVMLAASVVTEWQATGRACWQTSISAYYYTPVQAVFVGTLVAIGVCLVVLKGNTEWEDVLLNLAGMLAPVVALVPVPDEGTCRSVPMLLQDTPAAVANNLTALFVAGVGGLLLLVLAGARRRARGLEPSRWIGTVVSAAVVVAGIVWFVADRRSFEALAHYVSAIGMFACIVAVVVLNARAFGRSRRTAGASRRAYLNRYLVIAVLMVVSTAVMGLAALLLEWRHALLWVEGTLITLFAVFWLSQTEELWDQGLRGRGPP